MEGILNTFGIDIRLIVIQLVNFALLLVALWYFLYKPVLNMLATREEKIAAGIKDAEAAAAVRENAETEKKEILSAAHKEAEEVGARAKAFADEKTVTLLDEAKEKAESVVREAQSKGELLKQQAQKESEEEIAKLAVLAAERVLKKS